MPFEVLAARGRLPLAIEAGVDDDGADLPFVVRLNFAVGQWWRCGTLQFAYWFLSRPPGIILAATRSIPDHREALVAGVLDRVVLVKGPLRRVNLAVSNGCRLRAHNFYTLGCWVAPCAIGPAGDCCGWIPVLVIVRHQVVALIASEVHGSRKVEHLWGDCTVLADATGAGMTAAHGYARQLVGRIPLPLVAVAGGVQHTRP